MPVALLKPSNARLQKLADRLSDVPFTYPEVGATADPSSLPQSYNRDRHSVPLGEDTRSFDVGRQALLGWHAHRSLGARFVPKNPPLEKGRVLVSAIPLGPVTAIVPCRIVYVTDQTDRFGFAYGTLPGHPERGEESFHIVRTPAGQVSFEIVAFSRPADLLVRIGSPIARLVQVRATKRYLSGVREYVESHR